MFIPVKENSELSLACVSEGGNPKPVLTWEILLSPGVDRHAQKISHELTHLEEVKKEAVSSSIYSAKIISIVWLFAKQNANDIPRPINPQNTRTETLSEAAMANHRSYEWNKAALCDSVLGAPTTEPNQGRYFSSEVTFNLLSSPCPPYSSSNPLIGGWLSRDILRRVAPVSECCSSAFVATPKQIETFHGEVV